MTDPGKAVVTLRILMPDALLREWLQHVRDFEVRHMNDALVAMDIEAPGLSADETKRALESVTPPYSAGVVTVPLPPRRPT